MFLIRSAMLHRAIFLWVALSFSCDSSSTLRSNPLLDAGPVVATDLMLDNTSPPPDILVSGDHDILVSGDHGSEPCTPDVTKPCLTLLPGICTDGFETCSPQGVWGPCEPTFLEGEQSEICDDPSEVDEDCDGLSNEADPDCQPKVLSIIPDAVGYGMTSRMAFADLSTYGPASGIAFFDTNPDTITDAANDFVTAGLVIGDTVKVTGSTNNDGLYIIDTVTAGTLTLRTMDTLVNESAGAAVTISQQPTIICVDTNNDSNGTLEDSTRNTLPVKTGTFREAVNWVKDHKIILFEVSGWVARTGTDHRRLEVDNSYVMIAGQSAPSPGIAFSGFPLRVEGHDIVIQHIRVLPGEHTDDRATATGGIGVGPKGEPYPGNETHNVVIDHCTVGWQMDDNGIGSSWIADKIANDFPHDITWINSIIMEGLHQPETLPTNDGKGMLISYVDRAFVWGNLYHSNYFRNPVYSYGGCQVVFHNNYIYNPKDFSTSFQSGSVYQFKASLVGNVVEAGPNSDTGVQANYPDFLATQTEGTEDGLTHRLHMGDNAWPDYTQSNPATSTDWDNARYWTCCGKLPTTFNYADNHVDVSPLAYPPGYTPMSHSALKQHIVDNVGCRPADRSSIEQRIISELQSNGTAGTVYKNAITFPALTGGNRNVGDGMPSTINGHAVGNIPTTFYDDTDSDGYTDGEEWLHRLAAAIE